MEAPETSQADLQQELHAASADVEALNRRLRTIASRLENREGG